MMRFIAFQHILSGVYRLISSTYLDLLMHVMMRFIAFQHILSGKMLFVIATIVRVVNQIVHVVNHCVSAYVERKDANSI